MNFDDYANDDVKSLFKRFDSDEDRTWTWMAIQKLRNVFPEMDHYTSGKWLHVGLKISSDRRGDPYFGINKESKENGGGAALSMHIKRKWNVDFDTYKFWVKRQVENEQQVEDWLKTIRQLFDSNAELKRKCSGYTLGKVPKNYEVEESGDEMDSNKVKKEVTSDSLNTILYGSPGTGKTYRTINKALEIIDPSFASKNNAERLKLKKRFDQLLEEGKIAFTTFHQSFSYEDFIEGIRANTVDGNVEYKVEDGVFKKIAIAASLQTKSNFDEVYDSLCNEIAENGLVLKTLVQGKPFDVSISNTGNLSAIPQTGNGNTMSITKENLRKFLLEDKEIDWIIYARSIRKHVEETYGFKKDKEKSNYVLIIDEINRGNIANIFGELITLIEPSKRAGAPEALSVTLPYSKESFSVPDNLYIIGTMNTADRSLALMDTALRRRFHFIEMMPQPELLADIEVEGVNIQCLLERMNARITALYDREHTLGHAFFMPLRDEPTLAKLREVFERQILPLLQEYFFEDWNKIRLVVGKDLVIEESVDANLFDEPVDGMVNPKTYRLNLDSLNKAETYSRIYQGSKG